MLKLSGKIAWKETNLGSFLTLQRGFDLPQARRETGDVPIVSSAGVSDTHSKAKVSGPGLVTGRYGTIGEVFFIKEDFWPLNTTLYVRNFHGNDPLFAAYLLRTVDFHSHSGKSGVPGVNRNDLHQLEVLVPPLPEQRAIATALSDVDALINSLDRLIMKKRDIKQATMQQLLTGKTRLPGFSGEWRTLSLRGTSQLKARIGWHGLTTAEYLITGDYYLVTGTDFLDGRVDWDNCCFVDESRFVQDKYIQLRLKDVLITKDGTIGKVGYVDYLPGSATLNSGVFVIRPIANSFEQSFLYYVLKSTVFLTFLSRLQAGSTISHLYQKDFVNFSFMAPCLEEQLAIATVLSDIEREILTIEQRRNKTLLLKQGMMQELLTGRTRLV